MTDKFGSPQHFASIEKLFEDRAIENERLRKALHDLPRALPCEGCQAVAESYVLNTIYKSSAND